MGESPNWIGLLPCPFCNGAARPLTTESLYEGSGVGSSSCVVCTKCGAGGPHIEPVVRTPTAELERHAISKWNRRGNHAGAEWRLQQIARILNARHVALVEPTATEDSPHG